MTEKEFWTKYSRAEYLHSTKNVVAAAAEAAEDEELAVFLKQDDMLANEARRKVPDTVVSFYQNFYTAIMSVTTIYLLLLPLFLFSLCFFF
jgi:hypothetical protein